MGGGGDTGRIRSDMELTSNAAEVLPDAVAQISCPRWASASVRQLREPALTRISPTV